MNKFSNLKPILFAIVVSILLFLSIIATKIIKKNSESKLNGNISENIQPTISLIPRPLVEEDGEVFIEEFNSSAKVPYTYTLSNGEIYTIEIPVGIDPPPQAVVEKLNKMEKEGN